MEYFVTGASGFIGFEVTRQLLAEGHRVRALVRDKMRGSRLKKAGATIVDGDITEPETIRPAMAGVDGVFHIAGWYKIGPKDWTTAEAVNVHGTRNVLEAMRDLKIPKGVYTSTLAVYSDTHGQVVDESYHHGGPWLTVYDRTKWRAHYEVAAPMIKEGLPLAIVLPGLTYGPGDSSAFHDLLAEYFQRKLRRLPREAEYCFARAEDTARGHLLAMARGKPGESYILAGPRHSLVEVFDRAEKITGIAAPRSHPSAGTVRFLAALTGSERLRIATATYLGDSSKARRDLGFTAAPLAEGLPPTLEWESNRSNGPT